jgi:hypothetical protein
MDFRGSKLKLKESHDADLSAVSDRVYTSIHYVQVCTSATSITKDTRKLPSFNERATTKAKDDKSKSTTQPFNHSTDDAGIVKHCISGKQN